MRTGGNVCELFPKRGCHGRAHGTHLSSMMVAAFSQMALTLLRRHTLGDLKAFTVFPELSENSASMNAAVASAWPSLSSTFLIAFDIFLNVFISEIE